MHKGFQQIFFYFLHTRFKVCNFSLGNAPAHPPGPC